MVILAHLLSLNQEWAGSVIRILRVVPRQADEAAAAQELKALMDAARMSRAKIQTIVSDEPFPDILHKHSAGATVIFLGFGIPEDKDAALFQQWFSSLLKGMPTTLLIHSTGEADLTS